MLGPLRQPDKVGNRQGNLLVFEAKQDLAFGRVQFRVEAVPQFPAGVVGASDHRQCDCQNRHNSMKFHFCVHSGSIDNLFPRGNKPIFAAMTEPDSVRDNAPRLWQSSPMNEVAVIKTTAGEMVVEFWPEAAPLTVENFKKLARQGFYDGTAFHRIVKDFMIQGGDPLTRDAKMESRWGTGGPGYQITAEFNDRSHARGVVSMARSQDPDSAGSQFFICLADAKFLDRQYTAFGRVIKGDEVLGQIGDTRVTPSNSGEMSKPTARIGVESVAIVSPDSV